MSQSIQNFESTDEIDVTVRLSRSVLNKITHVTGTADYSSALTESALMVSGQYSSKTDPDALFPFVVQELDTGTQDSIGENIDINNVVK